MGSGSGPAHGYQIIKVTVRFRFSERKRLIRVFGLRSGLVRRPGQESIQLITTRLGKSSFLQDYSAPANSNPSIYDVVLEGN